MTVSELSGSRLLDALQAEEKALLAQRVEEMRFDSGHVLYEPGDDVRYAYFPRGTAVTSFHVLMAEGSAVETGLVGSEGAVGGIVSHGRLPAFCRSCVMHEGSFYRIGLNDLEAIMQASVRLRYLLSRYADCLIAQVFQSVACNAVHTIQERAAKWLIAAFNRTGKEDISLTQDQLSSLLGVGRTYVSRVVKRLKEQGVVRTRRGGIVIERVEALRKIACDCDHLVALHFDAVMKGVYSEKVSS